MDQSIITTSDRPDLAEQSSAALLADWPDSYSTTGAPPSYRAR